MSAREITPFTALCRCLENYWHTACAQIMVSHSVMEQDKSLFKQCDAIKHNETKTQDGLKTKITPLPQIQICFHALFTRVSHATV